MFTRKQYMNKECSHHEYYFQFGEHLIDLVKSQIGEQKIIDSTDPHFNDIHLIQWDRMSSLVGHYVGRKLAAANESNGYSLSDTVCAAKAAAKHIRDTHEHN